VGETADLTENLLEPPVLIVGDRDSAATSATETLEVAPGVVSRPHTPDALHDGDEEKGKSEKNENAAREHQRPEERLFPTFGHYNTVLFEITTMPLSVTVKRFLSSSGK